MTPTRSNPRFAANPVESWLARRVVLLALLTVLALVLMWWWLSPASSVAASEHAATMSSRSKLVAAEATVSVKVIAEDARQALQQANLTGAQATLFAADGMHVVRAMLATEIDNLEPTQIVQGAIHELPQRKLFFFTEVQQGQGQQLYHRWYFNDELVATIPLLIKLNSYRTYSAKVMPEQWQGHWKVAAVTEQGQVLAEQQFEFYPQESSHD